MNIFITLLFQYYTNVQFTKGFTLPLEYILYDFYITQAVQVRKLHGVINPRIFVRFYGITF